MEPCRTLPQPRARCQCAERALILSQPWPGHRTRTRTHSVVLPLAVREGDLREALGQLVRLAVAAPGSAAGSDRAATPAAVPVGLTTPMPIPADLAAQLRAAGIP
ncbi:DUF3703 domain-containing protein [Streptomyces sp. NPDC048295]|uniref:DUF3703 domain-containing protein n=1 Tax=Streptomyces sp. NPDC048295 TaxID=3154617 RepID=UPI00341B7D8C